jgi:hypothetical protein
MPIASFCLGGKLVARQKTNGDEVWRVEGIFLASQVADGRPRVGFWSTGWAPVARGSVRDESAQVGMFLAR